MTFLLFLGRLILADIVAVLIMSLGSFITALPLALISGFQYRVSKGVYWILVILSALPMVIFLLAFWPFWAAYCVSLTYRFTNSPNISQDWLYWITSFLCCTTLLSWLSQKEKEIEYQEYSEKAYGVTEPIDSLEMELDTVKVFRRIERGAFIWGSYTLVSYIVFAFYPSLMVLVYGPVLELLGAL